MMCFLINHPASDSLHCFWCRPPDRHVQLRSVDPSDRLIAFAPTQLLAKPIERQALEGGGDGALGDELSHLRAHGEPGKSTALVRRNDGDRIIFAGN